MKARELIRDALLLAGAGLVETGLWWVHPATALVTGGLLLFTMSVLMGRR